MLTTDIIWIGVKVEVHELNAVDGPFTWGVEAVSLTRIFLYGRGLIENIDLARIQRSSLLVLFREDALRLTPQISKGQASVRRISSRRLASESAEVFMAKAHWLCGRVDGGRWTRPRGGQGSWVWGGGTWAWPCARPLCRWMQQGKTVGVLTVGGG